MKGETHPPGGGILRLRVGRSDWIEGKRPFRPSLFRFRVTDKDDDDRGAVVEARSRHRTTAMHSISTRAPSARPVVPKALRAGLGPGKKVA